MLASSEKFGLYYHIPFCSRLCHYCDFVKTALFDTQLQDAYLEALQVRTEAWLSAKVSGEAGFSSVFFGGGTPSLIDSGYQNLLKSLQAQLRSHAELTLEANPEHVTEARLAMWASLGINRLSLGVQSFEAAGLKFLTREHSPKQAAEAVRLARLVIPNINIDLIYGWPGQTLENWRSDIEQALNLGATHLSLYNLTYEGSTPMARRVQRGVLQAQSEDLQESLYTSACARLAAAGMVHEEVSNWAYPGFESRHNSLYWHGGSYLGIGSGAHSHLGTYGPWGVRWKQDNSWRKFAQAKPPTAAQDIAQLLANPDYELESERDADAYIIETVSSGLRSLKGINLDALCKKTGYILQPRPAVEQALQQGLLAIDASGQLTLAEAEWYRETRWALEVSLSLLKT